MLEEYRIHVPQLASSYFLLSIRRAATFTYRFTHAKATSETSLPQLRSNALEI